MNIFYSILCILLIHISVNVNLRSSWCTRASHSETPCVCVCFLFRFFIFNPTDRPNIRKRIRRKPKKRGDGLTGQKFDFNFGVPIFERSGV